MNWWFANSLSTAEQNGHDQGMRKTNLDTVDEAIPSTLQDSEVVVVSRVGDDILEAGHRRVRESVVSVPVRCRDHGGNHMRRRPGLAWSAGQAAVIVFWLHDRPK